MAERVFARQFHAATGAEAWRVLPEGAAALFRTGSFEASVRFVDAIRGLVGNGEAPDVDIRGDGVTVVIQSFKSHGYGLYERDLEMARAISKAAAELGLSPDPSGTGSLSIIPGALKRAEIMPFWQAVLGFQPRPDSPEEDLVDPHGRMAPFWFEEMNELRPDGKGTMHLVAWVPWDQAQARLDAALAAGGSVVTHHVEEHYWTLADPAGNEMDLATTSAPEPAPKPEQGS